MGVSLSLSLVLVAAPQSKGAEFQPCFSSPLAARMHFLPCCPKDRQSLGLVQGLIVRQLLIELYVATKIHMEKILKAAYKIRFYKDKTNRLGVVEQ